MSGASAVAHFPLSLAGRRPHARGRVRRRARRCRRDVLLSPSYIVHSKTETTIDKSREEPSRSPHRLDAPLRRASVGLPHFALLLRLTPRRSSTTTFDIHNVVAHINSTGVVVLEGCLAGIGPPRALHGKRFWRGSHSFCRFVAVCSLSRFSSPRLVSTTFMLKMAQRWSLLRATRCPCRMVQLERSQATTTSGAA